MADVQLENGFTRVANQLLEAIVAADFTATQLRIVVALVRLTYGWNRKEITIASKELAGLVGLKPSAGFYRAWRELVDDGVIIVWDRGRGHTPHTVALQKDFERWGTHRVDESSLKRAWDGASNRVALPHKGEQAIPARGEMPASESEQLSPTGECISPPQGRMDSPPRGELTGTNSAEPSELRAPKDRKDRKDINYATTTGGPEPVVVLTAAANRGLTERYGEQPLPLRHSAQTSHKAAEAILAASVPLEFARDALYTRAKTCTLERAPRSLGYFTDAVLELWRDEQARSAAAELPLPHELRARVKTQGGRRSVAASRIRASGRSFTVEGDESPEVIPPKLTLTIA